MGISIPDACRARIQRISIATSVCRSVNFCSHLSFSVCVCVVHHSPSKHIVRKHTQTRTYYTYDSIRIGFLWGDGERERRLRPSNKETINDDGGVVLGLCLVFAMRAVGARGGCMENRNVILCHATLVRLFTGG